MKKKTTIIEAGGKYYEITILRSIYDFMRLREDIYKGRGLELKKPAVPAIAEPVATTA